MVPLNDFVTTLKRSLPPIEFIKLRTEADCYGMSWMISSALRVPFTPRSIPNWLHGWCFANLKYIEQFGVINNLTYLVATKDQELFFEQNGKSALAVGAPFTYAAQFDDYDVLREPNSLLVMPPHGLPFSNESWPEESYVQKINGLKSDFGKIVVCLHPSCVDKNKWLEEFDKYNIPWIVGADMHDKNALVRMHRIFTSFDYMTTNCIGSHVAYAAYSGCKVSIFGDYIEWTEIDVKDDELYVKYPHVMHHNLSQSSKDKVSNTLPFLFVHPTKASKNVQWASEELGGKNKKSYVRLAVLLGWLPHQQLYFWSIKLLLKIKMRISSYAK